MGKSKNRDPTPYNQSFSKRTKSNNLFALAKQIKQHSVKQTQQHENFTKLQTQLKSQHTKHKQNTAIVPYTQCQNMLLIGEGDFSFAHSLLSVRRDKHGAVGSTCQQCIQYNNIIDNQIKLAGYNITATAYDSEETVHQKYSTASQHIAALRDNDVTVLYNVDATQLHNKKLFNLNKQYNEHTADNDITHLDKLRQQVDKLQRFVYPTTHFDRILFLFPHTGSGEQDTVKNNKQHQQLIIQFLNSIVQTQVLKPDTQNGELHIVLKRGVPYDDWNVAKLARHIPHIRYIGTQPFYPHLYPQYRHVKTSASHITTIGQNSNNEFLSSGCVTYRFAITESAQDRRNAKRRATALIQLNELNEKLQLYESMQAQGIEFTVDDVVLSDNEYDDNNIDNDDTVDH